MKRLMATCFSLGLMVYSLHSSAGGGEIGSANQDLNAGVGSPCTFDASRAEAPLYGSACQAGQSLGQLIKAGQLTFEAGTSVCSTGLLNSDIEIVVTSQAQQTASQNIFGFVASMTESSSQSNSESLKSKNTLSAMCLMGLTTAMTTEKQQNPQLPKTKTFSGEKLYKASLVGICNSSHYEQVVQAYAMSQCAEAGYLNCHPVPSATYTESASLDYCISYSTVEGVAY